MKASKTFSLLFRKYPLFRTGSVIFAIVVIVAVISGITYKAKKCPEISSITPAVGSSGDLMTITGINFGDLRNASDYVEVGGSRITASGYLQWTDSQIKLILPSNVQDGLVIVSTKAGKSKPGFFANVAGIPVEVPPDTKTTMPVITSISPSSAATGQLFVLTGSNFGTGRNGAKVFFTAGWKNNSSSSLNEEISYIAASEENYDYEYWSDSEIHVRIPDGAAGGQIYVETEKGTSNYAYFELNTPAGTKEYSDKKTYLIHLTTDINDINSKKDTTLSLRIPRPLQTAQQPRVQLTECSPEPVFENYQNTLIQHIQLSKSSAKKLRFDQTFIVENYAVKTQINAKNVKPFSDKSRVLYTAFTKADELIKSDDERYVNLARSIVKKEVNPYNQAKLIYDYMIENYSLEKKLRKTGSDPADLIEAKKGDAFDFAIVYTTLLRSLKIPALPVSGILVDSELKSKSHWWTEFYIENAGWIPADVVLGTGTEYKSFKAVSEPEAFYFGNIDSQHVIFSRGFSSLKPTLPDGRAVYLERTFALQSVWEEFSGGTVNYSSLWNEPVITGIY